MEKTVIYKQELNHYSTAFHKSCVDIDKKGATTHKVNRKDLLYFEHDYIDNTIEVMVENYGNPLCGISFRNSIILIEQLGPKVSLKLFTTTINREVGRPYFQKRKHMWHLSFNLENGDTYNGKILNYQRKRKVTRKIRKNVFNAHNVRDIFVMIGDTVGLFHSLSKNSDDQIFREKLVFSILSNIEITLSDIIINHLESKGFFIPEDLGFENYLLLNYFAAKGIKYPNNFEVYQRHWGMIPPIKDLRKAKMKLIDAVMNRNGFKGDIIRKALHETNEANISSLKFYINLFDFDWVVSKPKLVKELLDYSSHHFDSNIDDTIRNALTKNELKKLFKLLLNGLNDGHEFPSISMRTVKDHLIFIGFLRQQNESIKLSLNNITEFMVDHDKLAIKVESYKKGRIERTYNNEFLSYIKSFVSTNGHKFYPMVLTKTDEFNEESSFQNNCVRTYVERPNSFIISLRNETTGDRGTIEYTIIKKNKVGDDVELLRTQYLGKFNRKLEGWDEVLSFLDKMVESGLKNTIFTSEIKKIFQNGHEISSKLYFLHNDRPTWESPLTINSSNSINPFDDPFF
jgi:hypothetical protein